MLTTQKLNEHHILWSPWARVMAHVLRPSSPLDLDEAGPCSQTSFKLKRNIDTF